MYQIGRREKKKRDEKRLDEDSSQLGKREGARMHNRDIGALWIRLEIFHLKLGSKVIENEKDTKH